MRSTPLILLLSLICSNLFAQPALPTYHDVVKYFFAHYSFETDYTRQPGFARKKDGWHVLLVDRYHDDSVVNDQLFYGAGNTGYKTLQNFNAAVDEPTIGEAEEFMYSPNNIYTTYGFERSRYYGYNGWDADMIADYGNKVLTNDTLQEGLARAYSAYASRYLWYQYGGRSLSSDPLQQKLGKTEMPDERRIGKVKEYVKKAIAAYNRLYRTNPSYTTLLGNIGMKCFNESFHLVMQLRLANREQDARVALEQCRLGFDDSVAAWNSLRSLEKNAILFTYGDNDTYPLLYLQEKYQLRTDASIVNTSMLGLPAYLQLLYRQKKVAFSTRPAEFGSKYFEVAWQHSETGVADVQLLDAFMNAYKYGPRLSTEDDSVACYPAKEVLLVINPSKIKYAVSSKVISDTLRIQTGSYMTMDNFMLLDIVRENIHERPIFFAERNPAYFEQYTFNTGVLYQLIPGETAKESLDGLTILTALETYLTKSYTPPFRDIKSSSAEYNSYILCHADIYQALLAYYLSQEQTARAEQLLQQCFLPFGKKVPVLSNILQMIPFIYKTSQASLGDELALAYAQNITKHYLAHDARYNYRYASVNSTLQYMVTVMTHYGRNTDGVEKCRQQLAQAH